MKKEKLLVNEPNVKIWSTKKENILDVYAERGFLNIKSLQDSLKNNETIPTKDIDFEDINLKNIKFIFITIFETKMYQSFYNKLGIYRISRSNILNLNK
jgi:hypothetical protein